MKMVEGKWHISHLCMAVLVAISSLISIPASAQAQGSQDFEKFIEHVNRIYLSGTGKDINSFDLPTRIKILGYALGHQEQFALDNPTDSQRYARLKEELEDNIRFLSLLRSLEVDDDKSEILVQTAGEAMRGTFDSEMRQLTGVASDQAPPLFSGGGGVNPRQRFTEAQLADIPEATKRLFQAIADMNTEEILMLTTGRIREEFVEAMSEEGALQEMKRNMPRDLELGEVTLDEDGFPAVMVYGLIDDEWEAQRLTWHLVNGRWMLAKVSEAEMDRDMRRERLDEQLIRSEVEHFLRTMKAFDTQELLKLITGRAKDDFLKLFDDPETLAVVKNRFLSMQWQILGIEPGDELNEINVRIKVIAEGEDWTEVTWIFVREEDRLKLSRER